MLDKNIEIKLVLEMVVSTAKFSNVCTLPFIFMKRVYLIVNPMKARLHVKL